MTNDEVLEEPYFRDQNGHKYTYAQIRTLMKGEHYPMALVQSDAAYVKVAVNQGIDAHLEACFSPTLGDKYSWDGRRLNCRVSPESLPVLLRRLFESDDEEANLLASDIITTLESDD